MEEPRGLQRLRQEAETRENRHDAPSTAAGAERRAVGRAPVAPRQRPAHHRVRLLEPLPPQAYQRPPRRERDWGKLHNENITVSSSRSQTGVRAVVAPWKLPPRRR